MELDIQKTVKVQARELRIYIKVCDNFTAALHDQDGTVICEQDQDYVPSFMPGEHFGDYLILNIDIETGQITNWKKPSVTDISEWVAKCRGETR